MPIPYRQNRPRYSNRLLYTMEITMIAIGFRVLFAHMTPYWFPISLLAWGCARVVMHFTRSTRRG